MTDNDRAKVRAVTLRLRQSHQKLFDLQGTQIAALREALSAVSATHDEMMALYQATNDLEDLSDSTQ
jgi:flagellar basal body P-ring protein FlgI